MPNLKWPKQLLGFSLRDFFRVVRNPLQLVAKTAVIVIVAVHVLALEWCNNKIGMFPLIARMPKEPGKAHFLLQGILTEREGSVPLTSLIS